MDVATDQNELNEQLQARFKALPKVIQSAITSADVQKELRALADTNKLHIDQWQLLENEVMLTLLGFQPTEDLADHLKTDLDVSEEMAQTLAAGISKIVFEPIRAELERELEQPSGLAAATPPSAPAPAAPTVLPATPPTEAPTVRIERAPVSAAYKAGETSTVRKSVEDDPYREPPA